MQITGRFRPVTTRGEINNLWEWKKNYRRENRTNVRVYNMRPTRRAFRVGHCFGWVSSAGASRLITVWRSESESGGTDSQGRTMASANGNNRPRSAVRSSVSQRYIYRFGDRAPPPDSRQTFYGVCDAGVATWILPIDFKGWHTIQQKIYFFGFKLL